MKLLCDFGINDLNYSVLEREIISGKVQTENIRSYLRAPSIKRGMT